MAEIDQAYAEGYRDLIHDLAEQKGSKLRGAVRVEQRQFNVDYFERLGPVNSTKKTSRFADSPTTLMDHSRRMVSYDDYQIYPMLDKQEDQRLLIDPRSKYVTRGVSTMGRDFDQVAVDAALGTAYSGQKGATAVALPAGQTIVHSSSGLTKAKLIEAREIIGAADADEDGEDNYIALTQYQISDILNDTTLTSGDYNQVLLLMQGKIDFFMGFRFIKLSKNILPKVSTTRSIIAWQKNGIVVSEGASEAAIVQRDDKSRAWQLQMDYSLGAVRMEEERIVEIECTE